MKPPRSKADNRGMSPTFETALVASHVFALLVLPALVAAWIGWRARRALRHGADSAAVYFGSVQWLSVLPAIVVIALLASLGSPLERGLRASLEGAGGRFASLLMFPFAMAPLALGILAVAVVSYRITQATRGTDLPLRDTLAQAAWMLASFATPVAGFLGFWTLAEFGNFSQGLAVFFGSVVVAALARARWAKRIGIEPHAVTHGALRDRLFALAAKAGATLQQLYVVPTRRSRMANAFAVQGGVVLLTDWLLENLDRREIDAVLAHELAHIRLGHPRKLMFAAMGGAIAGTVWFSAIGFAGAVALGTVLALLVMRFLSRRFEYAADALAIRLTGDPAALVTGLVRISRLNHLPLHWSKAAEHGLTHPSTLRRCEAIARAGGIAPERLRELLATEGPPADRGSVPPPAETGGKLFSSSFKRNTAGRLSWLLLLSALAASAVVVSVFWTLELPRAFAAPLAALAAFVAVTALTELMAARRQSELRRALAQRLGAPPQARFVGLSPGASTRVYEGFFDWDLGFLSLERDALVYRGEEATFRLPRAAVMDVRRTYGPPGWIPAPRVAIEWHDPMTDARGFLQLRPAHGARLGRQSADTTALCSALLDWCAADARASHGPCVPPPREEDVTGTPLARLARPVTLVPVLVLTGVCSLVLAGLIGLPVWPFGAPGALDAWAGAAGAFVLVRIPWWRESERQFVREARQDEEFRRAA